MMIFSLVAIIGLEKCCITSACLQWLCHSGERTVARGPLVLVLATAKRCCEIHALAMDANHLRFNQSDGSVSLIVQTGFLAKNQLPSICPDPFVIPNLASTCIREHSDRLLCPIRVLKFYLKMTSPYRQNRTRLFLPIKGKQDISKASVSRWISYY